MTIAFGTAVAGSTSVQPSETSEISLRPSAKVGTADASPFGRNRKPGPFGDTRAQVWMHGDKRPLRALIIAALDTDESPKMVKRVRRLEGCCVAPLFCLRSDGKVAVAPGFCRDRMCPTCQHHRGREVASRVKAAVLQMNAPRFLTLTLKHRDEGLADMLDRLYGAFRALRKTDEWEAHVRGGIGTLEVTRNLSTGQWHAHLHLLIDGGYWAQPSIKAAWEKVTKDSSIVHIEAVHDRGKAAHYISTYIGKPADVQHWPSDPICEYAHAMHGRRLVVTFGSMYRSLGESDDCETKPSIVEPLASVPALGRALRRGCLYAQLAYGLLCRVGGMCSRAIGHAGLSDSGKYEPLTPSDWSELAVALRRAGGDETAWLPTIEPNRRFAGASHAGAKRKCCTLRLFDDAGNVTAAAKG